MKLIIELLIVIAKLLVSNRHNRTELRKAKCMLKEGSNVIIRFHRCKEHKLRFNVWVE